MDSNRRPKLTFANVTSLIALFVALGGTATAAVIVTGKNVKNGSLSGTDVKNNSLGSTKIKNGDLVAKDFKAGQLPAGAQGAPGAQGGQGAAGTNGKDGAAGPSDVYADGSTGTPLDTTGLTNTEVASVTVPAGSYLLGAKLWLATQASGDS